MSILQSIALPRPSAGAAILARAIATPDREAWLAMRRDGIGSSDACDVVRDPLRLFLEKTGRIAGKVQTPEMRIGLLMEPVVERLFVERTGAAVAGRQVFLRHRDPALAFTSATIDLVLEDGTLAELKTARAEMARHWGRDGSEEIPDQYIYQVQHQMMVTGAQLTYVCVLIAGFDLRLYPIARNDRFIDALADVEARFWHDVAEDIAPDPVPARDAGLLESLYVGEGGWTKLDAQAAAAVDLYESAGEDAREAKARRSEARVAILAAMQDHTTGELPDGRRIERQVIEIAAHEVKASTQVRIHIKGDKR